MAMPGATTSGANHRRKAGWPGAEDKSGLPLSLWRALTARQQGRYSRGGCGGDNHSPLLGAGSEELGQRRGRAGAASGFTWGHMPPPSNLGTWQRCTHVCVHVPMCAHIHSHQEMRNSPGLAAAFWESSTPGSAPCGLPWPDILLSVCPLNQSGCLAYMVNTSGTGPVPM